MMLVNQFYDIKTGDNFVPFNYPEVEKELTLIRKGISHIHSTVKGEVIISYFKDYCLKCEWIKDYPKLTELITSRHFKTTHIQSLFDACRSNKIFLETFEGYIKTTSSLQSNDDQ
jgi:hypothetical protein